jgi:hypothetical protein
MVGIVGMVKGQGTRFSGESNPAAKLTALDVAAIRASTERSTDLARRYGVTLTHLSGVRSGRLRRYG